MSCHSPNQEKILNAALIQQNIHGQDPYRYYILLLFAFLGTQQCYAWYTFGSVASQTAEFFGMTKSEGDAFADMTMNYGAIVFVLVVWPSMWSLSQPNGLRRAIQFSAWLTFSCCLLRWLPCVLSSSSQGRRKLIWMAHVGQILNAACGATYQTATSRISAVWFPPQQRIFATAVAYMGGNLGMMIGYGLGAVFSQKGSSGVPQILLLELAIACIPIVLILWYCPDHPQIQSVDKANNFNGSNKNPDVQVVTLTTAEWLTDLKRVIMIPSFLLIIGAGGMEAGANAAWGGLLPQIFESRFTISEADELSNWCGLINCSGSLVGMLLSGWIADVFFHRQLKLLMIVFFSLSLGCNILLTVMFPTPWTGVVVHTSKFLIATVMLFAGMFQGCLDPLFLELAAEITFPSKEGISAGFLTLLYNASSLVVLTLSPILSVVWMNTIYSGVFFICILMVIGIQQRYLRSEHELEVS